MGSNNSIISLATISVNTTTNQPTAVEAWSTSLETAPYLAHSCETSELPGGGTVTVRYILKTQPGTRGKYTLIINPGPGLAICKLAVVGIGKNMACARVPTGFVDKYQLIKVGIGKNMACAR